MEGRELPGREDGRGVCLSEVTQQPWGSEYSEGQQVIVSFIALEFVLFMSYRGGYSFVGNAKQTVSKWLKICLLGLYLKQLDV